MKKETQHAAILVLILALAIYTRWDALLKTKGIIYPDELYENLEPAHRLLYGYGIVTWEYVDGIRSWFYPLIVYLIFKSSIIIGFNEIGQMIFFTRLFSTITSILLVYTVYALAEYMYGRQTGYLAAVFTIFSAPLLIWSARTMSFLPGILFSTISVYLLYRGLAEKNKNETFLSGLTLGISFMFYFNLLLFLIPMLVYAGLKKKNVKYFLLGLCSVLILQGFLDLMTWGSFLHSPISNFQSNIIEGTSSLFGVQPPLFYLITLIVHLPLLLVLPYAADKRDSTAYLFLTFSSCFLILSIIPHKEERFIFQLLPFFFILSAWGLVKLTDKMQEKAKTVVLSGFMISVIAISPFNTGLYGASVWTPAAENTDAMSYIGSQKDATGVAYTMPWELTGVYAYLHKDITTTFLITNYTDKEELRCKNPPQKRFVTPVGFTCTQLKEVIANGEINYLAIDSVQKLTEEESALLNRSFTEVKTFGKVHLFRRK